MSAHRIERKTYPYNHRKDQVSASLWDLADLHDVSAHVKPEFLNDSAHAQTWPGIYRTWQSHAVSAHAESHETPTHVCTERSRSLPVYKSWQTCMTSLDLCRGVMPFHACVDTCCCPVHTAYIHILVLEVSVCHHKRKEKWGGGLWGTKFSRT